MHVQGRCRPFLYSSSPLLPGTQRHSRHSTNTVPEFHAEAPQATLSEGLAQGPYVAARVGVEPMTLRTKGIDSTNAPHTPQVLCKELHTGCSQKWRRRHLESESASYGGSSPSAADSCQTAHLYSTNHLSCSKYLLS